MWAGKLFRIKVASGDHIDSKDYLRLREVFWIDDIVIEAFFKVMTAKSTHIHDSRFSIVGSQL